MALRFHLMGCQRICVSRVLRYISEKASPARSSKGVVEKMVNLFLREDTQPAEQGMYMLLVETSFFDVICA